jgi:hypothetical protein
VIGFACSHLHCSFRAFLGLEEVPAAEVLALFGVEFTGGALPVCDWMLAGIPFTT